MKTVQNGFATNFGRLGMKLRRYLATTALTATGLMAATIPATAENWTDHVATEGSISIGTGANTTDITQHTHFVKVQGNGDINAGWTVNVSQPTSSSKYVLYDTKDDPTTILGTLNANGEIYIFDKNGVIFGQDSQVNVGAIVASTGFISDDNIKAGKFVFENVGGTNAGEISNAGEITVAEAGLAAFVAPTIKNSGRISATAGKVVLASGEKVTLDLYGDKLVEITANDALANALIDNSGTIEAAGGLVVLSAQAAKNAVDNVINMNGIIDVSSVSVKGGKIVLGGGKQGTVKVAGTLKADGATGGGGIKVTGETVEIAASGLATANAMDNGNGGTVEIIADQYARFLGNIEARGGANGGNGGFANVSGYEGLAYNGLADLTASKGELGQLLLDPRFMVIHSGIFLPGIFQEYVISQYTLAAQLLLGDVTLQANDFIDVGTRKTSYALAYGTPGESALLNAFLNSLSDGNIDVSRVNLGFTTLNANGNLTLKSGTVNFNRDIRVGGTLTVDAGTVNVDSVLRARNGNELNASRVSGNAGLVNVLSNAGRIQQGVYLAGAGATVDVRPGTYSESVLVNKEGLILKGAKAGISGAHESRNGSGETVIDPNSPGIRITADGVTVDGLTITGAEGSDGYGVFVDDAENVTIKNNIVSGTEQHGIYAVAANGLNILRNKISGMLENGIHVDGSENVDIFYNTIHDGKKNGVFAVDADGARINNNIIYGLRGHADTNTTGIHVHTSDDVVIRKNTISKTNWDGIRVIQGENARVTRNEISETVRTAIFGDRTENLLVLGNTINNVGRFGVNIDRANGLTVTRNEISVTGQNGINVTSATGEVGITRNSVKDSRRNGIYVEKSESVDILRNKVSGSLEDGIHIVKSADANVGRNTIHDGKMNGVFAVDADRIDVSGNIIYNLRGHADTNTTGVHVHTSDGATIRGNRISKTNWDGIRVIESDNASVTGNRISETVRTAIFGDRADDLLVHANRIRDIGRFGINIDRTDGLTITENRIARAGQNGINVTSSTGEVSIADNRVRNARYDGIYVRGGDLVNILDNRVFDSGDDGIETDGVREVYVIGNEVYRSGDDGITLLGYADYTGEFPAIGEGEGEEEGGEEDSVGFDRLPVNLFAAVAEEPTPAPEPTPSPLRPWKAVVQGNTVDVSGTDGIEVSGYDTILVTDANEVSGSVVNGLYISGYNNGNVTVSGNIFKDNDIGAQFESGLIDLTGEGNSFADGRIGLRFAPYAFGEGEGEILPLFMTLSLPASGYAPLQLVDDGVGYPAAPGPFFGTIGSQSFTGYTEAGDYYVELANEAFFFPGEPTLLNGVDSTYDNGINPSLTSGILSQEDLDFLEARFQHYPDGLLTGENLGLFWFGTIAEPVVTAFGPTIDQKDLFNTFDAFDSAATGLNVRIVGLPRLPGAQATGNTTAQGLNNIQTFAGNTNASPETLNQIETASGGAEQGNAPENLSDIETEAGSESNGNDTSCWSDAVNLAGGGQAVNVVYQGTPDAMLDQAANCGTSF